MKMPLIEVKKSADGTLLARRHDGRPLTAQDRAETKMLSEAGLFNEPEETQLRAWIVEEKRDGDSLQALLICSALLEDHFWVVLDKTFMPPDGSAIYYPEELPLLKDQTREHLLLIHNAKLGFPGCRIIQEGPEAAVESAA